MRCQAKLKRLSTFLEYLSCFPGTGEVALNGGKIHMLVGRNARGYRWSAKVLDDGHKMSWFALIAKKL